MNRMLRIGICGCAASILMTPAGVAQAAECRRCRRILPGTIVPARAERPIKHIVLMIQENRTFNDLFAGFPGAVGTKVGKKLVKEGGKYVEKPIALRQVSAAGHWEPEPSLRLVSDGISKRRHGRLQSDQIRRDRKAGRNAPYEYVNRSQIQPYWDIASQWGIRRRNVSDPGQREFHRPPRPDPRGHASSTRRKA